MAERHVDGDMSPPHSPRLSDDDKSTSASTDSTRPSTEASTAASASTASVLTSQAELTPLASPLRSHSPRVTFEQRRGDSESDDDDVAIELSPVLSRQPSADAATPAERQTASQSVDQQPDFRGILLRTFFAWVRTSNALIVFGLLLSKVHPFSARFEVAIGLVFSALGLFFILAAGFEYSRGYRFYEAQGKYRTSNWFVISTALASFLAMTVFLVLELINAHGPTLP